MDYEHLLNEVAVQMAASQLSRYPRHSFGSTPKRWSGRVEKSRSTHTSPAIHERRRAHSTTRPVQPSVYQYPTYDPYSMPQQRPMRVSRPFSWHPTSSQPLSVYNNVSQMASPAASNYIQTPPIPTNNTASYQYPPMQTLYPDMPTLQKPNEAMQMMAASPVYSVDAYSSNSPEWDYFYDGRTPVIADNMLHNSSPTYPGSWYDSNCSQIQQLPQPTMHLPQLPPMVHQPSLSSMITQHQQTMSMLPATPSHAIVQESVNESYVEEHEEEEGEVLVALGLYDFPEGSSAPSTTGPAKLKLTETWQPPSDDEDSSQEEEEDDDEEVKTPGAGTSWFH